LRVDDLERMERWYREVLGLPLLRRWPGEAGDRSVWLDLGAGAFLALERAEASGLRDPAVGNEPGWSVLALRIPASEREAWRARLRSHGVMITGSTQWTLYFADPEGNRLGLSHHPENDPGGSETTTSS
jgi:catechol 2,3-dioxygenase-like lactoylglutathione lyase family enzyme